MVFLFATLPFIVAQGFAQSLTSEFEAALKINQEALALGTWKPVPNRSIWDVSLMRFNHVEVAGTGAAVLRRCPDFGQCEFEYFDATGLSVWSEQFVGEYSTPRSEISDDGARVAILGSNSDIGEPVTMWAAYRADGYELLRDPDDYEQPQRMAPSGNYFSTDPVYSSHIDGFGLFDTNLQPLDFDLAALLGLRQGENIKNRFNTQLMPEDVLAVRRCYPCTLFKDGLIDLLTSAYALFAALPDPLA